MEVLIIVLAAFGASILTFFSGFGLGTILLPVFALFFPIEISVALTGVVHLLNNLFKMILVGKGTHWRTVVRFGVPAIIMAFVGAWILVRFSSGSVLFSYHIGDRLCEVTSVKLLIALLMFVFAFLELFPIKSSFKIGAKHLPIGGALSGFFGGLSGHQGALRSAFLLKAGLNKEAFIATGVFLAAVVDISRISVYLNKYASSGLADNKWIILYAVLAAFAGAILGKMLLKKVTIKFVYYLVSILIMIMAIALGLGII